MATKKQEYTLSCLHSYISEIPPNHNDLVWCNRCGDYRHVGVPPRDVYRINCINCKKLRRTDYGGAFVTAETKAVNHALKYAGHKVILTKNDEEVSSYHHPAVIVVL